ncbi:MAG: MBL fold metallo-hydrolase [Candidatus Tectomicrobia bacterium]|uniref:MBL fold metallo-hydrolase n=1 Tax=Tectimicrobiota bacterium TaxID=2528274 RepID=A0A938B3A2_UNCTE|nr:MBL fold metallo-hydrolase [Candidatus Tectomicrobia bacterium]
MRIRFWGTRGSLPVALTGAGVRQKIKQALQQANGRHFPSDDAMERFIDTELAFPVRHSYGGSSACVEVSDNPEYVVCDMGSGLRSLGQQIMREHGPGKPQVYNFFMSHVHWDHIMGFPFFPPAYIPGNVIRIHGCHTLEVMQEALLRQQSDPCFPVDWRNLGADIQLIHLEPGKWYDKGGLRVQAILQPHHGDSYGYRFEQAGKVVVYSTDGEHKLESEAATDAMVDFYRNADLVIFDAMYSLGDMITIKEDWGHSSNVIGVELCQRANVKHYCMFHHEPAYDDATIHAVLQETIRYEEIAREEGPPLQVSTAYDGLTIEI